MISYFISDFIISMAYQMSFINFKIEYLIGCVVTHTVIQALESCEVCRRTIFHIILEFWTGNDIVHFVRLHMNYEVKINFLLKYFISGLRIVFT